MLQKVKKRSSHTTTTTTRTTRNRMSRKTAEAPKTKTNQTKKRQPASLISKLNLKLLQDRGRHCFKEWFTNEEIDSFRDNPDIDQLEPLFVRYQNKMEAALEDFAAEEGLGDPSEIIDALRQVRDERDEWKKLDKMIDTMTKKEEFFIMMMKKAERMNKGKKEPPHPDRMQGGGKREDSSGSKSSKK